MQTFQITGGGTDLLQIEDRLTQAEVPGRGNQADAESAYAAWFTGNLELYQEQYRGVYSALTYSAVWACVRWISQTIASLGWGVFEKKSRDRCQIPPSEDPVAWMLDMQANPEVDALNWRQTMLMDALTMGNGYSELEFDGFGRLRNMWRISSDRVCPDRDSSGKLIYEVTNGSGVKNTTLYPEEIFHLRGPSLDGIVGYSVISMANKTIQLGLSAEGFGLSFFRRGPMPGGVLTIPGNISPEAKRQQRESFEQVYGGNKNVGRVVVLTGGNTFAPLTLPNKDAEFIASREFGLEEVCRWYGVPPHKIADLRRSTNNNIEHQAIEGVQDCLFPWCRRFESEADIKLFGRVQRGKRYTRLNLASLLRGDSVAQTASITQKVNAGLMTPNEGREYFDMNPVDEGDDLLVQGAMIPLEQLTPDGDDAEDGDGLIEVPDLRQSFSYDCGAACTHSVAQFYGKADGKTEADFITELGTTLTNGTSPDAIIDWFNDAGLFVTSGNGLTIDDLKAMTNKGAPVIVPMQTYGEDGTPVTQTGHYVTVNGVGMGQVFFMDPLSGQELLPEDEFDAIWHDMEADGVASDHFGIAVYDEAPVPEEPPPPVAPKQPAPNPQPQPPDKVTATFRTLLRNAYGRLLRIEADKAIRAAKQKQLSNWSETFYQQHRGIVAKEIEPILAAFMLAMNDGHDAEEIADTFAGLHVDDSMDELRANGAKDVDSWESVRANTQAGEHMNRVWMYMQNGVHS